MSASSGRRARPIPSPHACPDYSLLEENGIVYISERNFNLSYEELLNGFVDDAASVRDAELIIFDIRSNGGGANNFCREWVENFCGQSRSSPRSGA